MKGSESLSTSHALRSQGIGGPAQSLCLLVVCTCAEALSWVSRRRAGREEAAQPTCGRSLQSSLPNWQR